MAWHVDAPAARSSLPTGDRLQRGERSSDVSVLDDEYFFVRGLVELPVLDTAGVFAWGAWVSRSRVNFKRAGELWNDSRRIEEPAYFGWRSNSVPAIPRRCI